MRFKLTLIFILIFVASSFNQVIKDQTTSSLQNQSIYNIQGNQTNRINSDLSDILNFNQLQQTGNLNQTMPIEGTVNLDEYIIGPNDVFQLGIFGYMSQQIPLVVNPEGSIVIPTVGEVIISDLSLKDAKNLVIEKVKKRYKAEVSFNLITPRIFLVNVTGLIQGKYQSTSLTRASEMLKLIFLDTLNYSRQYFEKMEEGRQENAILKTDISARNIKLIRKNGTVQKVDIYKYFMTNDDKYNPYLREGDLLKIPNILLEKNYITVTGAVQLGGAYEYAQGDDLETIIGLGRGFDLYAELDSILLFRPFKDKPGFEVLNLSFENNKNFKIEVYDRIFVKYKTDYQKLATVLILGEVNIPGYYPITFKNSRVKDVIEMAGGLKKTAYLPLSILFRKWDKEYLASDTAEVILNERANDLIISEEDKRNFLIDVRSRRNRVNIDFTKLIKYSDESQNVLLEDKDIIYINDNKNIVYVFGQVNKEGYVTYKEGADAEYYIDKAGGYTLAAEEGSTRIIKFHTRGYYKPGDIEIESGDFIYVSKVVRKPFSEIMTIVSQIAGIILGVLTTYILIKNTQ